MSNKANLPFYLWMGTDGNLVLNNKLDQTVWSTQTSSKLTDPRLVMQDDGNLVLDADGNPIYNTAGLPNNFSYFDIYENYSLTTRQFRTFGNVYGKFDNRTLESRKFIAKKLF